MEFCRAWQVTLGCGRLLLEHCSLGLGDAWLAALKCGWEQPCVSCQLSARGNCKGKTQLWHLFFGQHCSSPGKGFAFPECCPVPCRGSPAHRAVWMEPAFPRPSPA